MKMRFFFLLFLAVTLMTPRALAQTDALVGTWSGNWFPESGRSAVTVRFVRDGDTVTGEMLNPAALEFDSVSFDPATLTLVAQAQHADLGRFLIEATIEDETRLTGTLTHDDVTADMNLTKWTFRPG